MEQKQEQAIKSLMVNPRKLRMNFKPYAKLYWYCQAAVGEVSGFGKLRLEENGDYTLIEVKLLEQECSGGFTDLNQDAMANFLYNLAIEGKDPSEWNFWWHSHVNFGASPSSIDEGTMAMYSQNGPFVGLIINKRGEMWARVDFKGIQQRLGIQIVPTGVQDLMAECYDEVRKKVGDIQFKETDLSLEDATIEEIVEEAVTIVTQVPEGCGPVRVTPNTESNHNHNTLFETWDEDQGWVRACGFCKKIIRDKRVSKTCPFCGVDFVKTERV